MSKILIVGDVHLDRSLPHKQISEEGINDRYDLRLRLLQEATKDYEQIVFLGDITDTPNMIDGRIMYDFLQIVQGKKLVIQLLGNHDRHEGTNEISMGEILGKVLPNYRICVGTDVLRWGQFAFVLSSYYATEEQIVKAVEKAAEQSLKTLVLGHWNLYNELMGGKKLSADWLVQMQKRGVKFVLGHVHPPSEILVRGVSVGVHIGVLSPSRFKESQGYCLEVDTDSGAISVVDYPFGEEFIEFEYGGPIPAAKFLGNENKYIKVSYDPAIYNREALKETLSSMFEGCKSLILVAKPKEVEEIITQVEELSLETEEAFIRRIADEKGFKDSERIVEKHRQVKQMAL